MYCVPRLRLPIASLCHQWGSKRCPCLLFMHLEGDRESLTGLHVLWNTEPTLRLLWKRSWTLPYCAPPASSLGCFFICSRPRGQWTFSLLLQLELSSDPQTQWRMPQRRRSMASLAFGAQHHHSTESCFLGLPART